jgi:hypothetical protein
VWIEKVGGVFEYEGVLFVRLHAVEDLFLLGQWGCFGFVGDLCSAVEWYARRVEGRCLVKVGKGWEQRTASEDGAWVGKSRLWRL